MTTKLTIANQALGHLAVSRRIENLRVSTDPNAAAINNYYQDSKFFVLSDFDWTFSFKKRIPLTRVNDFFEGSTKRYVFSEPLDMLRRPSVFSAFGGTRYKVPFRVYLSDEGGLVQRVIETEYEDCTIDYYGDIEEKFYRPLVGLLQSFKLANLARNEITLGDGAISTNVLETRYESLRDKIAEMNLLEGDEFSNKNNSTLQAMVQSTGGIPGY